MTENIWIMIRYSILVLFVLILASSCSSPDKTRDTGWEYAPNMYEAIAPEPQQPNDIFANGLTSQVPPHGTVPIGFEPYEYPNTFEGYEAAGKNLKNPLPQNEKTLAEGKVLYLRMCSHCHGKTGKGDGSIVKLGKFPPPPSYSTGNSSRGGAMKDLTDGKIYHTIEYGLNLMGSHASLLSPKERWEVVSYVKELQKQ